MCVAVVIVQDYSPLVPVAGASGDRLINQVAPSADPSPSGGDPGDMKNTNLMPKSI
jgi:hypothetical protein